MALYQLYLESGPQRKRTMVHVPELLGCVVTGPTTDAALERTPLTIQAYLRFLQRCGEAVDPAEPVQLHVARHITEGAWLGNGDPALVLLTDLEPLTPQEAGVYIHRMEMLRSEVLALVNDLSDEQWEEKPLQGRSIRRILEHIFGAEYSYIRTLGKLEGVKGPGSPERMGRDEFLAWMEYVQEREVAHLRALTPQELSEPVAGKKHMRTAHKVLRRALEHQWEHLLELKERLAVLLA